MIGHPRVHFRSADSTNLRARAFAAAGAPHGTLVTAAEQSAGRGRQGRAWATPAGSSVLMSLILRGPSRLLSLAAGVAVAETAVTFGAVNVSIKWPNDVWVGGAKVAGILVEGRPQEDWAVLGIGLNAQAESFPPELGARATSLGIADVESVLAELLERLAHWTAAPDGAVLDSMRSRDALLGREIAWSDGAGTATGIDADGKLMVATPSGRIALDAGEVHLTVT
jgi:BirA family biotin operon repressor/biotin-[acetyl-CoA-carboxylase] ligase